MRLTVGTSNAATLVAHRPRSPLTRGRARGTAGERFIRNPPEQETALQLVTAAAWPRLLRTLRSALGRNRDPLAWHCTRTSAITPALSCPGGLTCGSGCPKDGLHGHAGDNPSNERRGHGRPPRFLAEPPGGYLRCGYGVIEADWVDAAARVVADAVLCRQQ